MEVPEILKLELSYSPAILLLGIYQRERENTNSKTCMHPCVPCSIIAIAEMLKLIYSSMDEWIKKWYVFTVEQITQPYRRISLSFAAISHVDRDKYQVISLTCGKQ